MIVSATELMSTMSFAGEEVKIAPYGSWKSPLSSKVVSKSSILFQDLRVDPKNPGMIFRSFH